MHAGMAVVHFCGEMVPLPSLVLLVKVVPRALPMRCVPFGWYAYAHPFRGYRVALLPPQLTYQPVNEVFRELDLL